MDEIVDRGQALLQFFKALGDEKRLQIVGLLSLQDYSVEELAAVLDLSSATVSHHLQRLARAGLVEACAVQHFHVYSLKLKALNTMSQQVLSQERLQHTTEELDLDAYDRKVLCDYVEDGRPKSIPRQWKKRDVISRFLLEQFEPDRSYPEKEVNEIISRTHADYATLRRALVDSRYLARERDIYWRVA